MKDLNRLGEFLRARRERISPEEHGLPVVGRRRTPGLRREEVAERRPAPVEWVSPNSTRTCSGC